MGNPRSAGEDPILSTPWEWEIVAVVLFGAAVGLILVPVLKRADAVLAQLIERPPHPTLEQAGSLLARVPAPGVFARRWTESGLARRLAQAGLGWKPEALVGLRWVSSWMAGLAAAALMLVRRADLLTVFLAGLVVGAGAVSPGLWLVLRADRRRQAIDLALPDFLDRLALGLDAGLSFELAFRRTAVNFRGLLGNEMRRVARQIDRGHARASAMDELGERNPSPDLQTFVATVRQAETLGTSLADSLRVQTGLLQARRRRRAEEASRRLPVLVVFPLVLFFLPALLIIYLAPPLLHLFLGR